MLRSLASKGRTVRFAHLLIFTDKTLFSKFHSSDFTINNKSFTKVRNSDDGIFRDYLTHFLLSLLKKDCTENVLFAGISHGVLIQSLLKEKPFAKHIYLLDSYDTSLQDGSKKTPEDALKLARENQNITFSQNNIPDGLVSLESSFSLIHFDTVNPKAELKSVPLAIAKLNSGGILILDTFYISSTVHQKEQLISLIASFSVQLFIMPTLQIVIIKN